MSECKLSQYAVGTWGYPNIKYKGKLRNHHRVIYAETHNLDIDVDMINKVVRHTCDNRRCINPDHLQLGTQQDNMDDMLAKDRQYKGARGIMPGSNNPNAKLTDEIVLEIFKDRRSSQLELAKKHGISRSLVQKIQYGQAWTHITKPSI